MPVFAVLAMALFIRQTEPNVNTVVGLPANKGEFLRKHAILGNINTLIVWLGQMDMMATLPSQQQIAESYRVRMFPKLGILSSV